MTHLLATLLLGWSFGQQIPPDVHYKKATPEVNAKFSKMLSDLFADKIPDSRLLPTMTDAVICGPGLWPLVRKIEGADAGGKPSKFVVPSLSGGKGQVLEGRTFQTAKDRLNLLQTLQSMSALGPMKIRIPTKEEIQYYWAIIPYDIEEPLMIAENKKITLLINGDKEKIFFVDSPGQMKQ